MEILQILHFVIHGGKTGYVFVIDDGFFTLGTTPGNGGLLGGEVNSQAQTFDESAVIHVDACLFSHEEQEIFRKGHLILSEGVAKIYTGVFGFKGISASVAEALKIQTKNENTTDIVNSIGAYKSMSSFPNNKTGLGIDNLINVDKVTVVINMHFLQESLLLRVQLVSFLFIFINIREFLRQARRRG